MTIWTIKAKDENKQDVLLPDFDDDGDKDNLYPHLAFLAGSYLTTQAVPQTPIIEVVDEAGAVSWEGAGVGVLSRAKVLDVQG